MKSKFTQLIIAALAVVAALATCEYSQAQIIERTGFYRTTSAKLGKYIFLQNNVFQAKSEASGNSLKWGLGGLAKDGRTIKTSFKNGRAGEHLILESNNLISGRLEISQPTAKDRANGVSLRAQLLDHRGLVVGHTFNLIFVGATLHPAWDPDIPLTKYISHRGSTHMDTTNPTGLFPSNTRAALEMALLTGYQGFEVDVHLSADNQFILSHDNDLEVATDCEGLITESHSKKIGKCLVQRSGLLPESGFASDQALVSARVITLKETFQRYLKDPRVDSIVVDLKPHRNLDRIASALDNLLAQFDYRLRLKKVIVLVRTNAITRRLAQKYSDVTFALESNNGWEPLDEPIQSQFVGNGHHNAISLSLGLGLGLNGGVKSIGKNAIPGLYLAALKGDIDIEYVRWSDTNIQKMETLLLRAHQSHRKVIGWTVNGQSKLKRLYEEHPGIDYILSDSPYLTIARIQLDHLLELTK